MAAVIFGDTFGAPLELSEEPDDVPDDDVAAWIVVKSLIPRQEWYNHLFISSY